MDRSDMLRRGATSILHAGTFPRLVRTVFFPKWAKAARVRFTSAVHRRIFGGAYAASPPIFPRVYLSV